MRKAATATLAKTRVDPDNRLLSRMPRRRLSVESYRDAILSAAGRLESSVGGRSIQPDKPEENRRTLYSQISRMNLNPMLARFDFPDPNAHSATRFETTTPLQKLFLLNSPVHGASGKCSGNPPPTAWWFQSVKSRMGLQASVFQKTKTN